jgi:hypothetical protein
MAEYRRSGWRALVLLTALCFWPQVVRAQDTALGAAQTSAGTAGAAEDNDDPDSPPTMFPHLETDRLWLSGQANFISQWHPAFHSPYFRVPKRRMRTRVCSRCLPACASAPHPNSFVMCRRRADTASAKRLALRVS